MHPNMLAGFRRWCHGFLPYNRHCRITFEEKRKRWLVLFFYLFGIPTLLIFGLFNTLKLNGVLASLDFTAAGVLAVSWVYLKRMPRGLAIYRFNMALAGITSLPLSINRADTETASSRWP